MGGAMLKCGLAKADSTEKDESKGCYDDSCARERTILREKFLQNPDICQAAIVAYPKGTLRCSVPDGFTPTSQSISDLVDLFKGRTAGIEKRGLQLAEELPIYTPGKMDEVALYCSDGENKGCVVIKTDKRLLIVAYKQNPDSSIRAAEETGRLMMDIKM